MNGEPDPLPGRPLTRFPVHLGLGATAVVQPEMSGPEWYDAYATRNSGDGAEGRLVALHSFDADWTSWEMHPAGDELVVCVAGGMTLIQQLPGGREQRVRLGVGDYAINPPGAWHTADVEAGTTALFVTAGLGTQHRPRQFGRAGLRPDERPAIAATNDDNKDRLRHTPATRWF